MFIAITENHSGKTLLLRRLAPNESADAETQARNWAEYEGVKIAYDEGIIPAGCGDYRAETRRTKEATGTCWHAFDFYLSGSEF